MSKDWLVYILKCADDTLYTGVTNNLEKRLQAHNQGQGAKYTRGRTPVLVIYEETVLTRGEALKREAQLKKLTKKEKLELAKAVDK